MIVLTLTYLIISTAILLWIVLAQLIYYFIGHLLLCPPPYTSNHKNFKKAESEWGYPAECCMKISQVTCLKWVRPASHYQTNQGSLIQRLHFTQITNFQFCSFPCMLHNILSLTFDHCWMIKGKPPGKPPTHPPSPSINLKTIPTQPWF